MQDAYDRLQQEGTALAGGLTDLVRRAAVYHHLYADSGGRNVFPLIAAHGALWGSGYFALGSRVGHWCSLVDVFQPQRRRRRLDALSAFANAFRDINRQVCAQAYALYHYTRLHGRTPVSEAAATPALLDGLLACHTSARAGTPFSQAQRAQLFQAFFLWEQHHIVSTAVEQAVAAFEWPLLRRLAMQPRIRFRYFPRNPQMRFGDFAAQDERIEKGLRAYALAEQVGLAQVEVSLRNYGVLPGAFFNDADRFFRTLAMAPAL